SVARVTSYTSPPLLSSALALGEAAADGDALAGGDAAAGTLGAVVAPLVHAAARIAATPIPASSDSRRVGSGLVMSCRPPRRSPGSIRLDTHPYVGRKRGGFQSAPSRRLVTASGSCPWPRQWVQRPLRPRLRSRTPGRRA